MAGSSGKNLTRDCFRPWRDIMHKDRVSGRDRVLRAYVAARGDNADTSPSKVGAAQGVASGGAASINL